MPLAFPSHQGLVAPLWRRWPHRFSVLATAVGAAIPDVVDGLFGLYRGHLGQAYGHSLAGVVVLCVPVGLALNAIIKTSGRRLAQPGAGPCRRRLSETIGRWSAAPVGTVRRWWTVEVWSVGVGAFSHLVFDALSHRGSRWLYPWCEDPRIFPEGWYRTWLEIPVPFYERPYSCGPPFIAWLALSVVGGILLVHHPGSGSRDRRTLASAAGRRSPLRRGP